MTIRLGPVPTRVLATISLLMGLFIIWKRWFAE